MRKFFERLYTSDLTSFHHLLETALIEERKRFVITANPETFMIAQEEPDFASALLDKDTIIVPDGIGIVKAAHYLNYHVKERIPGVEVAQNLLELGNTLHKSIYIFGSRANVIEKMSEIIERDYPHLTLCGAKDGYVKDKDIVFLDILEKKPDIILVAMGIPAQEKLIYRHFEKFNKGVFVGVGGSIDVLSGLKRRAPKLIIRLNLEWMYRICKEPYRIQRFYKNNMKFLIYIRKLKKERNHD